MSGIAALVDRRGNRIDRERLERVSFSLLPFGRHRREIFREGALGCAFTCFVNAPEARFDRQPVLGADGNVVLLFDGRLDNRDDLAGALFREPDEARAAPDSQFALLSWERWGSDAPRRWVGEFATLVWDTRSATLTAVVDPVGRRQLVHAADADLDVIASAPRALFAAGVLEPSIDRQAMADHLGHLRPEGRRTFFEGVQRIPAGHLAAFSAGRPTQLHAYYEFAPGEPLRLARDEDYVEAGLELLGTVVKAQSRATGTLATDLSGGLDSSLVAAHAARLAPGTDPIPAFTINPAPDDTLDLAPGKTADESPRVRETLEHLPRLQPTPLAARGGGWDRIAELTFDLSGVPAVSAHFEETWARKMEAARELGVTALLTGHPGNVTLSWYGRGLFLEHFRSLRWLALARELYLDADPSRTLPRRIYDYLLRPAVPRTLLSFATRVRDGALFEPVWHRFSVIAPGFAAEQRLREREQAPYSSYDGRRDLLTALDRAALLSEMARSHGAAGLQMARAAFGIEIRNPLWDLRVVEWSLRVPDSQFRRNGVDRWLARRMAARILPARVAWNRTRGLQDASWHSRIAAELPQLREQVRTLAEDADTAGMIDTARIDAILAHWDDYSPDRISRHQRYLLVAGIQSAIHAGRFVRWVRGANC